MTPAPFLSSSWYRVANLQPKLREHATVHRHDIAASSGMSCTITPPAGCIACRPRAICVVGAMDGNRTVDQLWQEARSRLGQEAPSQDELIQLLVQLNAADLLQTEANPEFGRALRVGPRR